MARAARQKSFIVGIAGPIGSGKSTVAALFAKRGFAVWLADEAVSELYRAGGAGSKRIGEYFGAGFLDGGSLSGGSLSGGSLSGGSFGGGGAVRRSRLVRMISTAPLKLRVLESLIHPLVVSHAQHWIDAQRRRGVTHMVLESAVFEPKGLGRFIDALVYVDASRARCRARVVKRLGAAARLTSTARATARRATMDGKPTSNKSTSYFSVLYQQRRVYDTPYVIANNGTRRALNAAFETVFETLLASVVQ